MELHREMTAQKRLRKLEAVKNKNDRVARDTSGAEVTVFSHNLVELCVMGAKRYTRKYKTQEAQKLIENTCSIFDKAIAIAPGHADLHREFAIIYIMTATDLGKAQKLAKKAVALEGSAVNYYILGSACLKNSNRKKALSAFSEAVKRAPENKEYKQAYDFVKREGR